MNILKEYLVPSICGRTYLYGNHADASVSSRIVAALTMQIDPTVLAASLQEAVARFPHFCVGLNPDGGRMFFKELDAEVPVFKDDADQPFAFDDPAMNGYLFKVTYVQKTICFDFHRAMADEAAMMTFVKSVLFNYLERAGYPVTTGGAIKLLSSEYFKAEGEDAMVRLDDAQASRPVWYMDAKAVVPADSEGEVEEVVHIRVPVSKLRRDYADIVNIPVTYVAPLFSHAVHEMYGGEMEPGPSSMYVRPFAEALEKLKPSQVSEIVETEFGFHIIELIDKKGENYHCRHILLRPSFTRDELMQPAQQLDSIARLIRLDSITFEDAALRFSDDASSRNNGGIVSNHDVLARQGVYDGARLTATRFLKEDFGQMQGKSLEDYNALMRLKEGEISNSFQTTVLNGNQLSKIVKLVQIIPPHIASLEDDYIRIEEMALEDKQTKVYNKWLHSKIEGMYIYIAPEYRSDEFEYDGWIK